MTEKKLIDEISSSPSNEQYEKSLTLKSLEKETRRIFLELKNEIDLLNKQIQVIKKVLR